MIKLKDELVNFPLIDLDNLSKANKFPENVRTAVMLYNKAIDRIKFNSSDIAMIELKKAIKIFPEFYDAILLLSLCCYANDEKSKAINLINTIRDEEERSKCFRYLDSVVGKNISGSKQLRRPESAQTQRSTYRSPPRYSNDRTSRPPVRQSSKSFSYYLKLSIKGIVNNRVFMKTILLLTMLVFVFGVGMGIYTLYNVNKKASEENAAIVDLETKYIVANNQLESLEKALQTLKNNNAVLIKKHILPLLQEKYGNKDVEYESIVEIIYLIDTSIITDNETKTIIEQIQNEILPIYAVKIYDKAKDNITESKYNEAINKLEDIIKFYPDYQKIAEVKLDLGKAYQSAGNTQKAIEVLEDIVKDHGQSAQVTEAKNMLNEFKGNQEE